MIRRLIILLLIVGCEEPSQHGCLDSQATNYDATASIDNNSCTYIDSCGVVDIDLTNDCVQDECGVWGGDGAEENYDCDGNCMVEIDGCGVCGGSGGNSGNMTTINDVEWTLDEYTFSNTSLTATGVITNVGDPTILAPWSVEAEFYSDSTFTLILGGDQQSFNVNLQQGVSIQWTLSYSDPDKIEFESHPYFAINNFRAFISKN